MREIEYLDSHSLKRFLSVNEDLANQYYECKAKEIHPGFNLFLLISETYYKENFHSDILKSLLDPHETHNEGFRFLKLFLEYLNKKNANIKINIRDFENSRVYREKGRIDILIKDETTKKALIIENKINGYFDRYRQIPRYHETLTDEYDVVAVVYLLLSVEKKPETDGWKVEEKETILSKLVSIVAYNESNNDLYNGWIVPCEKVSQNSDALFVLRQYGKLLKYLGGNKMNKQILEVFYKSLLNEKKFKTAFSLKSMFEDLPNYRIERLVDTFIGNSKPFYQVIKKSNNMLRFEGLEIDNSKYAIDIIAEPERYKVQFWDEKNANERDSLVSSFLQSLGLFDDFYKVNYWYEKVFDFPKDEKKLYDYITEITKKLEKYKLANR